MKTQQIFASKNQLELDRGTLNTGAKQEKSERDKWLADYGALSNKMEVMEESTKHWRKNSNEAFQSNKADWFTFSIRC
jgi:chemotaxis protein MotB